MNNPVPYSNIPLKTQLNQAEKDYLVTQMACWYNVGAAILGVQRNKIPCHLAWSKRADGLGYREHETFSRIYSGEATGIALICGPTSGIVGVGCDEADKAEVLYQYLNTLGVKTACYKSQKGIHFLFKNSSDVPHTCCRILPTFGEVDVRSHDRGYLILPGSLHYSGCLYEWIKEPELSNGKMVLDRIPDWLLEEIYKGKIKKLSEKERQQEEEIKAFFKDEGFSLQDPIYQEAAARIEFNTCPSLADENTLPPRIRRGCFRDLLQFTLPKSRWTKLSKHEAAKNWIMDGEPILEGQRYHAEMAIGGLAATCYANPTVAIRILETFRYVYIPHRRSREGELEVNEYIEKCCIQARENRSPNKKYTEPPDRKLDPKGYERFWYNVDRRQTFKGELIERFLEKKINHKRYEKYLSTNDYLIFLLTTFGARLLRWSEKSNSSIRAKIRNLLQESSSTSSSSSNNDNNDKNAPKKDSSYDRKYLNYQELHKRVFGEYGRMEAKPLRALLNQTTSAKKTIQEIRKHNVSISAGRKLQEAKKEPTKLPSDLKSSSSFVLKTWGKVPSTHIDLTHKDSIPEDSINTCSFDKTNNDLHSCSKSPTMASCSIDLKSKDFEVPISQSP